MGVDVVRSVFEQVARGDFGLVNVAGAEIEVGQTVIQLRRSGVGVECILVLIDGQARGIDVSVFEGFVLVDIGQGEVIVGDSAIRRRCGIAAWRAARPGVAAGAG